MKRAMTMTLTLPHKLDDDTVLELWYFLNDLSEAFEHAYGHQVRRAMDARRPAVDPQQPWLPFDDKEEPEF